MALQSQRDGGDQNEVRLCCTKERSLNVSLVLDRNGSKICKRDDLFIYQDIGITEDKMVKVEIRKPQYLPKEEQKITSEHNETD